MHRAAFHVGAERGEAEEAFAAVQQRLRLTHRFRAIEQRQGAVEVGGVVEVQQALDAAVDQPACRVQLTVLVNPVAAFADRFLVADGQCQQRLEFADAQFLPGGAGRNRKAKNLPQRPFIVQVRRLQVGQQRGGFLVGE